MEVRILPPPVFRKAIIIGNQACAQFRCSAPTDVEIGGAKMFRSHEHRKRISKERIVTPVRVSTSCFEYVRTREMR